MATKRPENDMKDKCMKYIQTLAPDVWGFKVYGNSVQTGGIPDILMCIKGRFVSIELKRPDGKGALDPRQDATLHRINKAGGYTEVIDNFESFKATVNRLL